MSANGPLAARGVSTAVLVIGGLWLAAVVCALLLEHLTHTSVPTCVFKRVTGHPCPTCGSTRAGLAILRGDPVGALAWNPLMVALLAGLLVLGCAKLTCLAQQPARPVTSNRSWTHSHPGTLTIILLVAIAANWAYVIWHGN